MKLRFLAAALALAPISASATTELVSNGGFESGDFPGWSCDSGTSGFCAVSDFFAPHSGDFYAVGFNNITTGTLSQTIATTLGVTYDFSFWSTLESPEIVGPVLEYNLGSGFITVPITASYAQTATTFVAAGATTDIMFRFDTIIGGDLWKIDDVSVSAATPVPLPAAGWLFAGCLALLAATRRRSA